MKKISSIILLVSFSLLTFSGMFTETINKIIDISNECQKEALFTKTLYDLSTSESLGTITYIPFEINPETSSLLMLNNRVAGFLIVKFLEDSTKNFLVGSVKLTGNSSYNHGTIDRFPGVYFLNDNHYIQIDDRREGNFLIVTDKEYVILNIITTSLKADSDYVLTFSTARTVVTFEIHRNSSEYQKLLNILKEK